LIVQEQMLSFWQHGLSPTVVPFLDPASGKTWCSSCAAVLVSLQQAAAAQLNFLLMVLSFMLHGSSLLSVRALLSD
jgi:hypothetical protein